VANDLERSGKYIEVNLVVPKTIDEIVCNYIIENLAGGLILEDEDGSDRIRIKFYLPENVDSKFKNELSQYINSIDSNFGFSKDSLKIKDVPDIEWVQHFRDSIEPLYLDGVAIRPPWGSIPDKDYIDLIIEPKMAFGTGRHESTRLCIKSIQKNFKEGQSFFDLGCGNGILSVLAAKKNGVRVKGVDIDPIAVDNAREIGILNGVANKIEFEIGSIESAEKEKTNDFFVANIIKETILDLYDRIDNCTKDGGIIVLSGLLQCDEEPIVSKLKENGLIYLEITKENRWIAFTVFK